MSVIVVAVVIIQDNGTVDELVRPVPKSGKGEP
jgi:hypothetical protein